MHFEIDILHVFEKSMCNCNSATRITHAQLHTWSTNKDYMCATATVKSAHENYMCDCKNAQNKWGLHVQLQEQKAQLRITHVQWQDCKVQMREIAHMCNCKSAKCKWQLHMQLQWCDDGLHMCKLLECNEHYICATAISTTRIWGNSNLPLRGMFLCPQWCLTCQPFLQQGAVLFLWSRMCFCW